MRSINIQNSVLLSPLVLEVTSHAVPRDIMHQLRTGLGFMTHDTDHWMVCVSDLVLSRARFLSISDKDRVLRKPFLMF